jgi:hypothetical protein
VSDESIHSSWDVSAALARGLQQGGLVLEEAELGPEFFDLRTGLAGELFQKFVNYRAPLAIVIPDPRLHGERFSELAHEHRRHPTVRIFPDRASAEDWLDSVQN